MSYGGGLGAGGSRSQGYYNDSFRDVIYPQEPSSPLFGSTIQSGRQYGDSFDYEGGFKGDSRSIDAGFGGGMVYSSGREMGFGLEQMRSGLFLGSTLQSQSSSSLSYFDPSAPRYNERSGVRFDDVRSRDRNDSRSSERSFDDARWRDRNDSQSRERLFDDARWRDRDDSRFSGHPRGGAGFREMDRGRNGGSARDSRNHYWDRRDAPPPLSDTQRAGSGTIWYAGPRCSLIKDAESGDQVFMYNSVMQPQGTRVTENMEVLYGAFYDKKFIKKHRLTTLWEAAWVEVYEDEQSSGSERCRSRSPIERSNKPNRIRSPKTAQVVTKNNATNNKTAAETKKVVSKEMISDGDDAVAHEESEGDNSAEIDPVDLGEAEYSE